MLIYPFQQSRGCPWSTRVPNSARGDSWQPGETLSGAGMVLLVDISQPLVSHMGIYLGRGDIAMTQQHLDHAQVGPMIEQMGCESMP